MTTPSSPLPQGVREHIDTGPLSWVMGEIREALGRSKTALHDAIAQDAETQSTTLRHAKSYLHQAHGALQIVDVDGVAIITETVEDLFDRIDAGRLALTRELAQTIDHGYEALIGYLDELLSGMPHQPVRLFPYYRALLEARGAERIHPADLFFPNLAIRPQPPAAPPATNPRDYVTLRQHFEKALLPFLKSSDDDVQQASAALLRDIVGEIESTQGNPQSRAFWWVLHGFVEAVAAGRIRNEVYVRQLFARINLQIRRLSQGSSSIAERLLRDALFFIAQADNPPPRAQQIRRAYCLDGLVPADYGRKRYGQVDADALAAAKERLSQAKNIWNRIAGGDATVAESFEQEMLGLAEAGARLNAEPLTKLLRELGGIARHAGHCQPGDMLGLEMATSLLFIENSLHHIGRLPDDFAERARMLSARLLSIVAGEPPTEAAHWLDDMSRQAQQRQTMAALAGEMQTSLRQIEKMLDEYFRDPAQRSTLTQLDTVLHQIEGALAILDQDDAMRAIQHTRAAVQRFVDAEIPPDMQECRQVAQNVGALGFFIESLQFNAESAKKQFSFDDARGVFQARLVEKNARPQPLQEQQAETAATEPDSVPPVADAVLPTVEEELARHQQQSAELAMSLSAEPDNPALQEQLKESLQQIRLAATLVDNPEVTDRARTGIDILERPDFAASRDALAEIIIAAVPSHTPIEPAPLPAVATPATDEAIDAELLEIFLSEAEEVLGCIGQTIPESRNEPHNQEHLTTLRRSFHTLKGSGRMVGLVALGEAAWSIEQVLNLRLSESRSGDADLYALLNKAAEILAVWVEDLQAQGRSNRTAEALVQAAERVKAGQGFLFEENEARTAPVDAIPAIENNEDNAAVVAAPNAADDTASGFSIEPELQPDATAADVGPDLLILPLPEIQSAVEFVVESAVAYDPIPEKHFDVPAVSPPADDIVPPAEDAGPAVEPPLVVLDLPAVSGTADRAESPEMPAQEPGQHDNIKRIGNLEISVPLHNIYLAETDELVRLLSADIAAWRHEPERRVNVQSVHAAHSLAGSSATVGFTALREVAYALEACLQFLSRKPVRLTTSEYDTLEHSVERLKLMLQTFALGEMPIRQSEYVRLLTSMQQDIEARAEALVDIERQESVLPGHSQQAVDTEPLMTAMSASGLLRQDIFAPPEDALGVTPVRFAKPPFDGKSDPGAQAADPELLVTDELDADLLPVFLEEGRDMLPQAGQALRAWKDQPDNAGWSQSLLRLLHTLKGSSRMAGAMSFGQHLHDMETRIENIARAGAPSAVVVEDLLARHDESLRLFEELQNPGGREQLALKPEQRPVAQPPAAAERKTAGPEPVVPAPRMPSPIGNPVVLKTAALPATALPAPAGRVPLVRVRADILDRLVNQAGEVSISRSKLETEVTTLRQSLSDLTENVTRLRDQLREIEIQAETQIASRMAHVTDREFDPLEFDRFTRLQELTRMMAESVNDVGSLQQNLSRTLDNASGDLSTQARLTRDLQQDLMRVRMVQFASISERLFRVTRQTAKEVDKRVNLDIRGGMVEIDRSVLEKMTGPFEHLLRNAIVHGIESREARRAAGKSEVGELLVEVRQEGNEVVIRFSDDGQGLSVNRIRAKAKQVGLLDDDSKMSDEEVTDLIFHPGFSTAEEITELAGRGVGMDVVRSEAAALGGRVATRSEPGKGAHFTIHLPLTLAVTQVVLLSSGGKTYAVPSVLVEQVQQLKANPLATAYNDGAIMWQGQRIGIHYLPALLGDYNAMPAAQQLSPLLILKSGSDRIVLHVDEILGNREVVVKNIGPQLARMIGIAGATVLGSGEIVLILNPVPLAQRAAQENVCAPRIIASDAPEAMGAVAELAGQPIADGPVQGLRTQNIVMVVDDSLTVRRVTQRLLTREGYQVMLAKDGVDALEYLQSLTPDVMLVDIEMPRMDGFDLTRNVRRDERTRHIPIIMITSRIAAKHRNYAIELGVNEYLGKPYQEQQLLGLITSFVGKVTPTA